MPRPRSFEPAQALERAMDLFWVKGYEATSIDDLVAHLRVTRPALYRRWGSKQAMYNEALQHYREQAGREFVEALESRPEEVVQTIRNRLDEIVSEAVASPDRRGCFVVNAACERAATDPATGEQVTAAMQGLVDRITDALVQARGQGIIDHPDPAAVARFIVVVIQGIRVVGKALPDPAALAGVVDQAMAVVACGHSRVPA